jgi:hypothetical protein
MFLFLGLGVTFLVVALYGLRRHHAPKHEKPPVTMGMDLGLWVVMETVWNAMRGRRA